MRLKSIIASAFTALMVACPVLAFSESADFDDSAGERLCRCAYDHRNTKG